MHLPIMQRVTVVVLVVVMVLLIVAPSQGEYGERKKKIRGTTP